MRLLAERDRAQETALYLVSGQGGLGGPVMVAQRWWRSRAYRNRFSYERLDAWPPSQV